MSDGPVTYIAAWARGDGHWLVIRCFDDGNDTRNEVVARTNTEHWAKALARRLDETEDDDSDE